MSNPNPNPKTNSSVQGIDEPPPFGSRFLTPDADVWSKNAWDHVPPPEGQDEKIEMALNRQKMSPVNDSDKHRYNSIPAKYWDQFYSWNENNFFKDRKWLHNEFPELLAATRANAGTRRIVEVGCGAGNTVFPLLRLNENPLLEIFACDYSAKAVEVVKSASLYSSPPMGSIHASVWDLADKQNLPEGVEPGSIDIIVMIFVLSALHPNEWRQAVSNVYRMLRPGGMILMRDYGRHDLTQLRFKEGRLLDDNLYARGDGTRVYFFTLDEVSALFTGRTHTSCNQLAANGIIQEGDGAVSILPSPGSAEAIDPLSNRWLPPVPLPNCPPHPLFSTEQLGVDRRLILNRKRQLKMYRVWIQGKFLMVSPGGPTVERAEDST